MPSILPRLLMLPSPNAQALRLGFPFRLPDRAPHRTIPRILRIVVGHPRPHHLHIHRSTIGQKQLGHRPIVLILLHHHHPHRAISHQPLQIIPTLHPQRLGQLRRIDAAEPHLRHLFALANSEGVAIMDRARDDRGRFPDHALTSARRLGLGFGHPKV
jgi:hypothetical protein